MGEEIEIREMVLDVSVYPYLLTTKEQKLIPESKGEFTLYVPDTLKRILEGPEERLLFYEILYRWFPRKRSEALDLRRFEEIAEVLGRLIRSEKFGNVRVKLITGDMVDEGTYERIYKYVVGYKRIGTLPIRQIIGDLVAKTVGGAVKLKIPILMKNERLIEFVEGGIPVMRCMCFVDERLKSFKEKKEEFFEKVLGKLPLIGKFLGRKHTRWIIALPMEFTHPLHHVASVSPQLAPILNAVGVISVALFLLDPRSP